MLYQLTKFGPCHKLERKALKAFGFAFNSSARTCVKLKGTATASSACAGSNVRLRKTTCLLISPTASFRIINRDFHTLFICNHVRAHIRENKRPPPSQSQSKTTWTLHHSEDRSTQTCLFGSLFSRLSSSTSGPRQENVMNVFDRNTKRIQRNRTALLEDPSVYDYLKEEVCETLSLLCMFECLSVIYTPISSGPDS